MTRPLTRLLGILALIGGLSAADALASQAQQPFSWWRSDEFKRELGLSADQIARIDKIYESTRPELRQEMDELSRYDSKLQKLIETSSDEALLARQIDRVETARANLNKTRALMIARMRLVLSADQRTRLRALYEQREHNQNLNRRPNEPRDQRRPAPETKPPTQQGADSKNRPGC
jgi:Spy/CpxP family protein refolding chaperone